MQNKQESIISFRWSSLPFYITKKSDDSLYNEVLFEFLNKFISIFKYIPPGPIFINLVDFDIKLHLYYES